MVNSVVDQTPQTKMSFSTTYRDFIRQAEPLMPASLPAEFTNEWPAILSHHLFHAGKRSENPYQDYLSLQLNKRSFYLSKLSPATKEFLSIKPFESSQQKFKFIDLFAGVGGFRLALNKSGGRCVFSSEWDNSAKETYFNNHKEIPFGDVTKFTNQSIEEGLLNRLMPEHDVLAAGFPCQPFSRAGVSARTALNKKHGFECNTQGTLFYDVVRVAAVKRPRVLFLENVRNLKSHDEGNTFKIIQESIEELGYSFSYALINAQTMVPQKRIRCYMICVRNDIPAFELDLRPFEGEPLALSSILQKGKITSEYQISEKLWTGHINRTKRNLERGAGFTALEVDIKKPANTLVARYGKDGKECLIPTKSGEPPRKLTRREAARLQGYPDNFILPQSKTPTYKQMGNSVAVPVVSEIARQIADHLREHDEL